jgi:V8-like Glu-specific endopeptidase
MTLMMRLGTLAVAAGLLGGVSTLAGAQVSTSADGRVTSYTPTDAPTQMTADDRANAKSRLPMLTDLSQVPGMGDIASQGYGTGNHPFTTKGAYANAVSGNPTNTAPFRSTGKLWMRFGSSWFVCTASVIDKGVLVTAAHCVWNYGGSAANQVEFEPARHGTTAPYDLRYGVWTAATWTVPSVYANGTDTCTVAGIVCANDIAVVRLNTGPSPHTGKHIAEVVGRYSYYTNNQGYIGFLGKTATQITQLGYPVAFDSGYKMIRTDSLGYQEAPFNVIIGSDQTGGSSGGPWMQNFGVDPVSASSTPSFNARNRVVATTSWGYVSSSIKLQGASRFANNPAFPAPGDTNIKALISAVCGPFPANCY